MAIQTEQVYCLLSDNYCKLNLAILHDDLDRSRSTAREIKEIMLSQSNG
jgi:hypothetical protein